MKKLLRTFLLAAALTALLCVSALAADSTVSNVTGNILTPKTAEGAEIIADTNGKYTNAVQFDLTATEGLTNGSQYLVLMLKVAGENTVPTAENIYYINQKAAAADGKLAFTNAGGDSVYPMDLVNGTYSIYIVGEGKNFNATKADASFTYEAGYTLGDVDGDGKWTANDALYTLQIAVNKTTLKIDNVDVPVTDAMRAAANADKDKYVTANDALLILQKAVGKNVF